MKVPLDSPRFKYLFPNLLGVGLLVCVSVAGLMSFTTPPVGLPSFIGTASAETTSKISQAPAWTLNDVAGNPVKSSSFDGKVRVIDFWATWCPPCRAEIPNFVALQSKFAGKGLQVIGISMDDSTDPVAQFIKSEGINYPIVMGNEQIPDQFGGSEGIPTTFIIDRSGRIVDVHTGYTEPSIIEDEVKRLL